MINSGAIGQLILTEYLSVQPNKTYTLQDNPSTSANDSNPVGDTTADTWCSSGWLAGSSYSLTRLDLNLEKNGSPTGVITVKIYNSTNGTVATGTPSTLLGTSNTINASSLTTGFVQTSFLFSTPVSITSGTGYFVAINYSIINASNYVIWGDDSTIHTSCYYESADAITWNQICLGCLTPNLWTYSSP